MKLRIRETYLIFLIVIGLVSLSLYTTYAMFTATTTIKDVVDFDTSLTLTTSLSEYELITLTGNETQVIEVNVTNSYNSTLCYGIWYEVVSGDSSSLDIGTFTEKNTTLPSGQITSGNTVTAVVGMSNGSTSSITLKLGTIGRETSGSSCSLGITSPRSLIGTEWADAILVTDEYLSEHTTTSSEDYSWSSSTSGSTTLTLKPGTYKLEVWGAQGGSYDSTYATGGKGGYSYGTLTLSDETTVYAYVGGQGTYGTSSTYTATSGGGFNGGGNAGYRGGGGGGASDIRIGTDSLYARVIVAGGGGGAYSYSSTLKANGGVGGGTTGGDGSYYSTSSAYRGYGGTQSAGGASGTALTSGNYNGTAGSFGIGGDTGYKYNSSSYYSNGAGGGGWYGGGAADNYSGSSRNYSSGGGGGSGWIYTLDTSYGLPSGWLLNYTHHLADAATIAGDQSFNDFDETTVTGHSGDGAIKITGTTNAIYSIPTLDGLTTLRVALGANADYTTGVEVVCASGTTGCSIVTYPTLDTSTLEEGTYTVYYIVKGADNKKYKYARTVIIGIKSINTLTKLGLTENDTIPNFNVISTTNEGIYLAEDDQGTSCYFRGAVDNNWVYFAGIYWRIIRINGDGSIRMIYSGTTAPTSDQAVVMTGTGTQIITGQFNFSSSNNEYVRYTYDSNGTETDSAIKNYIETWYENTFLNTDYEQYLMDTIYCNDREISTNSTVYSGWGSSYDVTSSTLGQGTTLTIYKSEERLGSYATPRSPSLKCSQDSDKYTVSTSLGNGKLKYKVGLITADEIAMAGGKESVSNTLFYLYTNSDYWSLTPRVFLLNNGNYFATTWRVSDGGALLLYSTNTLIGIRPVISIIPTVTISGNGTYLSPFRLS